MNYLAAVLKHQQSWTSQDLHGIQEARHAYPLVCDHDRELMRKSVEAAASASCGEPTVAVGQQGQQSERAGHEAWVGEDILTPPLPLDLSLNASNPYDLGVTYASLLYSTSHKFSFLSTLMWKYTEKES